ncbi:MAG: sulfite exporter TauE/SafE family protein [Nitrospirae bacterium]|nr:sulfite exporter TauE/SafE family protein [Nitrospirota bacterium]MBF0541410.1 sulfite exporter TauE/SafE family protein [Nitrospirota bacterium]
MSYVDLLVVGFAAILGGAVNALAGGGTLITFPMLTAVGVPAVAANVTNTVALCPGYLGATFAQMKDLKGQMARLWLLLPVSLLGGVGGGVLLLKTGDQAFRNLVPYLILMAVVLLAFQDKLRAWVISRSGKNGVVTLHDAWVILPVIPAAVYGGYFGAGVSVIVLAVLGLVLEESFTRLNALKQSVSFSINIAAAIFFIFSGKVVWSAAIVMAVCALVGGVLGGRLAGWIKPEILRRIVVVTGTIVAVIYFVR